MANENASTAITMDDYLRTTSIGSVESAISDNMFGINPAQTIGMVPNSKDEQGYVFFTRPQLNMQKENIANSRVMYSLLSDDPNSIGRYIRGTLDPRLPVGAILSSKLQYAPVRCNHLDPYLAFIAPMTNNIISLSGWPDPALATHDSTPGLRGEVHGMVDSAFFDAGVRDLSITMRGTKGDCLPQMIYIWCLAASMTFEGTLMRYFDYVAENCMDYNTRVYRLVLNEQKTHVTKIACNGYGIWLSPSIGSMFDYNREDVYNKQNDTFNLTLRSYGTRYFDPIVVHDFNETVCIFNSAMYDNNREKYMTKIPHEILGVFKRYAYPRVNPDTSEMEWWAPNDYFNKIVSAWLKINPDSIVS